jgi:nicotinate dehydrogenase subunit B
VLEWESEAFLPELAKDLVVTLLAAELAGLPRDEAHPGNIHQSLAIPYAIPNIRATVHWLAETPFRVSWIRTPYDLVRTYVGAVAEVEVDPKTGKVSVRK